MGVLGSVNIDPCFSFSVFFSHNMLKDTKTLP